MDQTRVDWKGHALLRRRRDSDAPHFHSRADDQIWKVSASGGNAVSVTREGGFEAFESADGRYLVYSKSDGKRGIWRLDMRTGQEEPIPALAEAAEFRQWALAPRGVYFVPNAEIQSPQAAIGFFDFTTGQTSRVAQVGPLLKIGAGTLARMRTGCFTFLPAATNRDIMLARDLR